MKRTRTIPLVFAGITLLALVAAATTEQYSGGAKQFTVVGEQGGGGTWVDLQALKNKTGKLICDFVVAEKGGQSSGGKVIGIEVVGKDNFKFDDNNDKTIDTGEDDNVDPGHGGTGRSIKKGGNCIGKNADFTINVKVITPGSMDFIWQATGKGVGDGSEGPLIGRSTDVTDQSAVVTETIYNAFQIKSMDMGGRNTDSNDTVTGIRITPPTGIAIASVSSEDTPGQWNAATKTFTFTTGVAPAGEFHVVITLASLASGDKTTFQWEALY